MHKGRPALGYIAAAAAALTLANLAWDVLGPLWTTASLGLGPDDWARLRSLRFAGTLAGTVIIGLASGVWGARTVGAAAFLLAGLALGAISLCGLPVLVVALPMFGAAVSAIFIALNTLTQQVGPTHQARANSVYRSVGAGVGCIAPLVATATAALLGYTQALAGAAVVLALGGGMLLRHRGSPSPGVGGRAALKALMAPLASAPLRRLILTEQSFVLLSCGGVAFTALVLALDLGLSDRMVGAVLALGAAAAFAGTLMSHRIQQALGVIRTVLAGWALALVAALLFATARGASQAAAALVAGGFAAGVHVAPTSFLVARLGGSGCEAQTFTLWKIAQSVAAVVGMQLCAALEPRLGMHGVIAWGAIAASLPVFLLWRGSHGLPVLE